MPWHARLRSLAGSLAVVVLFAATALGSAPMSLVRTDHAYGGTSEFRLANGLRIVAVPRHDAPVVALMVLYRVGSRNEGLGETGAAHLLEHMMFKGTPSHNRARGNQFALEMRRIGASFSASTGEDRTNYWETVPSDALDTALALEADRMQHLLMRDADRRPEMTVVRNEMEIAENDPATVLDALVQSTAVREHPYHHPTLGWISDVENVPTSRLAELYRRFYRPDNAVVIAVGDFDVAQLTRRCARWFGGIGVPGQPVPAVYTQEPPQQGAREVVVRRPDGAALVELAYRIPGAMGQERTLAYPDLVALAANPQAWKKRVALDLIAHALADGRSAVLQRRLVDTGLASSVTADARTNRDPIYMATTVTVANGSSRAIERTLRDTIKEIADGGIRGDDFARYKALMRANYVYATEGAANVAQLIGLSESVSDWRYHARYLDVVEALTERDVAEAAQTYLTDGASTVGFFNPKDGATTLPAVPLLLSRPPAAARVQTRPTTPTSPSFGARTTRTVVSGARIIVSENHASQTVAYHVVVSAGRADDGDRPGIAELTARVVSRATARLDAGSFAARLDELSASLDVRVSAGAAHFTGEVTSPYAGDALPLIAEALRTPRIDDATVTAVKGEMSGEASARATRSAYQASRALRAALGERTYEAMTPGEQASAIARLSTNDVRAFYQARYRPENVTFVIAGDVAPAAGSLLSGVFTGWPASPAPAETIAPTSTGAGAGAPATRAVTVQLAGKANVDAAIGTRLPPLTRQDDIAFALVDGALGKSSLSSLLAVRVRDTEGLSYRIRSRILDAEARDQIWAISLTANPRNADRAVASAQAVVAELRRFGMPASRLRDEKTAAIGAYRVALTTNADVAEALAEAERLGYGPSYLDEHARYVERVRLQDVNRVLRSVLVADRMVVVQAGDLQARR